MQKRKVNISGILIYLIVSLAIFLFLGFQFFYKEDYEFSEAVSKQEIIKFTDQNLNFSLNLLIDKPNTLSTIFSISYITQNYTIDSFAITIQTEHKDFLEQIEISAQNDLKGLDNYDKNASSFKLLNNKVKKLNTETLPKCTFVNTFKAPQISRSKSYNISIYIKLNTKKETIIVSKTYRFKASSYFYMPKWSGC